MNIKTLIENKDYVGIQQALSKNPDLANEGLPFDTVNTSRAHPLHRICDGVCGGKYADEEGVKIAKLFLTFGARVNGDGLITKKDTPLIAAASLGADEVGILYIENGADIHHTGTHGGTALHWAAWCGREKLVKRLLEEGAEINRLCIDFTSTPLFWAIHGYWSCGRKNLASCLSCVGLILEAGADKSIPNFEGYTVYDMLDENDVEWKHFLGAY